MTAALHHTVGQIVAANPSRARVFERHRIDYCCGGKLPLADACERKSLDPAAVLAEIEQVDARGVGGGERDWSAAPMGELADHIVESHHGYLREELPRIAAMAARVAKVHGDHAPEAIEVEAVFSGLRSEMMDHMMKEEQILFPWIKRLESGGAAAPFAAASVASPIHCMEDEHESAGRALERLRELTSGFEPPADACNTWRVLYAALAALEGDMHVHVHKENSILFPRALEVEAATQPAASRAAM